MATDFAHIGRLLAAPARSAMLDLLLDGTAHPAGDLAACAGVSASTASEHLTTLVEGGMLRVRMSGRHRYYEIADARTAEALEVLGHLCPTLPVRSLRQARTRDALEIARTCYDHLAGRLGVALHDAMVDQEWLDPDSLLVTPAGSTKFGELGIDVPALSAGQRRLSRGCLDWTERRTHLAGALGKALADSLLSRRWVRRMPTGRALKITPTGERELLAAFSIDVPGWNS